MYREITYKAGATKEIIRYYPKGTRKGITRGPIRKKTREEIREANRRMAQRELERIMNANFRPGDWHVTLTYRKELRPTPEEARDTLKKFLGKLRRRYRKNGFELKYIVATEYLSKHIHHHLVVNAVNTGKETTADMIRELWTDRSTGGIRGNPKFVQLYDNGEYSQLASYLIKETDRTFRSEGSAVGQRYSCSRNLVHPQKQVKDKPNKTWKKEPQPSKGYYILQDSLYNGFDRMGYPYQRYVQVKLNPCDADWEKRRSPSGACHRGTRLHSSSRRSRAGGGKEKTEKSEK